VLNWHFSSFHS